MALTRYSFDSVRSCVWVSGRSSLHPINTETRGITGWFEAATSTEGSLDLDQAVSGELELAVDRLTSGNQLYDRELRRRIDARRYPTIGGPGDRASSSTDHTPTTSSPARSPSTARRGRSRTECRSRSARTASR